MKKNTLLISLIFLVFSQGSWGQSFSFDRLNQRRNWRMNKREFQLGLCATQFNGDLGGAGGPGIDYRTKDIDWQSTGSGLEIAYKYRFKPYFATKTCVSYFKIQADDKYSEEGTRNMRNLHFRSRSFDISQRFELIVLANESNSRFYNLTANARKNKSNAQLYLFGGIGLMYFNPQAMYNGTWTNLQALKTEGQSTPYSRTALIIPTGLGIRFGINERFRIGVELAYTKTFSDYIDDVSTTYTSTSNLSSSAAVYLANPSGNSNAYGPGEKRGDPNQKDAYYKLSFQLIYNLFHR